jgi:hypothetical protein
VRSAPTNSAPPSNQADRRDHRQHAAYVGNQFEQNGVFRPRERSGLSMGLVTRAALGNQHAIAQLNPVLERYAASGDGSGTAALNAADANRRQQAIGDTNGGVTDEQARKVTVSGLTRDRRSDPVDQHVRRAAAPPQERVAGRGTPPRPRSTSLT